MDRGIQPVRGMNDVLPAAVGLWQRLERTAREVFGAYGYQEIRLPLLERTELFKRSIGEFTDIVEKEMYTFEDRGGDSLTLRPEATAGVVRAMISNGLLHNQRHRLWCGGPMFRYERPQKGRFRQFHQLDVEAIGYEEPDVDAELILLSARLWRRLGIRGLKLKLNSLGTPVSRREYRKLLVDYLSSHRSRLDEDSLRRLEGNPLRVLDSKNPEVQQVLNDAPLLMDHLDVESAAHFRELRSHLDAAGVEYEIEPRLVRGLDYYTRTVFEWVTTELGAQDAVCSGGRYDGLVEQLGGEPTPAVGWALGQERIVDLMQVQGLAGESLTPDLYIVVVGEKARMRGLALGETIRNALPELRVETHSGGGSFKSQLRRADRSGARFALILGEDEVDRGVAGLKPLRADEPQEAIDVDSLTAVLGARFGSGSAAA